VWVVCLALLFALDRHTSEGWLAPAGAGANGEAGPEGVSAMDGTNHPVASVVGYRHWAAGRAFRSIALRAMI
jgi:hypothetical protein